jgi:hypothetical protein
MKFTNIMVTSFTKLTLFPHKISFTVNILFPPLRETMYANCVKLFAAASEVFDASFVSVRHRPQNGVHGFHPSEDHKMEVGW